SLSRMTIVTHGSEQIIEQITKQLNKLIDVVRLLDLSEGRHIERELLLLKVIATGPDREEIKRLVDIFRGRIIDVDGETYTIELTGPGDKLNAFLDTIPSTGIVEVVRSGVSGIARGERALRI
ncbi:MAG: acetolactate synthase small subunit, partial [Proteobacteria bacterium]|nr:acetolactate synthase small subunit [Pseudomonadota bacterium]